MKYSFRFFLISIYCLFAIACSDGNSNNTDSKKEHVWKEQTDTINKAKEVEGMMLDSAEATRKAIEKSE